MLIALFTDIHANREAFEACLAHVGRYPVDRFVFLGRKPETEKQTDDGDNYVWLNISIFLRLMMTAHAKRNDTDKEEFGDIEAPKLDVIKKREHVKRMSVKQVVDP